MTEVKPRKTFNCGTSVVNTLIFNDKVEKIFSGDSSGMALCWDISKGQNVREYPGHQSMVTALCSSSNDNYLFTGG
jgi:WD40 repeat protein